MLSPPPILRPALPIPVIVRSLTLPRGTNRRAALLGVLVLAACGRAAPDERKAAEPNETPVAASAEARVPATPSSVAGATSRRSPRHLAPEAERIAGSLVFVPRSQTLFTAAVRGKRLLVDLGRVDLEVRKDSSRLVLFREVVADRSPLRLGDAVVVRGSWGDERATVAGFEPWNGRITAVLDVPPRLDTLVQRGDPLVGVAMNARDAVPGSPAGDAGAEAGISNRPEKCRNASIDSALAARLDIIRDSLDLLMRAAEPPLPGPIAGSVRTTSERLAGCFGPSYAALLLVSQRASGNRFLRERAVLVDTQGGITPVRIIDYRFKAHDLVHAFDADGDGWDDVAAKGVAEGAGGTVVLRLTGGRLERLTSGFVWEAR